ncbi:hypothetical protein KIN20_018722 [Parelaphostrongylus tenuis]|uniref:Uncharacterized protein n=1 Tax=Parelaphostrongylus tenuis TaxID=148309 RepID=A0AAD5MKE1_PARTN|nr:hypothetical protein KIN20_018722 [Parelaphostrongylus tenuis]
MNELLLPAFFDDLRIDDDANHVLKATTGNGIRFDDDAVPVMSPQDERNEDLEKVRQFLSNLKNYPEWARFIPYVKLNAAVPRIKILEHTYLDVFNNLHHPVNEKTCYLLIGSRRKNTQNVRKPLARAMQSNGLDAKEHCKRRLHIEFDASNQKMPLDRDPHKTFRAITFRIEMCYITDKVHGTYIHQFSFVWARSYARKANE